MHSTADKTQENNNHSIAKTASRKSGFDQEVAGHKTNLPELIQQQSILDLVHESPQVQESVKRQTLINDSFHSERTTQLQGVAVNEFPNIIRLKSSASLTGVAQLASIKDRKLFDNKNKQENFPPRARIKSFDVFANDGSAKTIKIMLKGNGELNWFLYFDKDGPESKKQTGALPEFYFDIHDIPGYLPEWGYGEETEESNGTYGKIEIKSFKTPSGEQTVDVKKESKNKITVERKFTVDALFDESKIKPEHHVEYRQYIKGYFKYMDELNPHKLYKGVALDAGSYNEDGNGPATPYGRRGIGGQYDKYNTDNPAAITYHATDIPGMQLNKNERCEINLSFVGKLVVVANDSEDPVADLLERSWSFKGKVNNRGNGIFDVT